MQLELNRVMIMTMQNKLHLQAEGRTDARHVCVSDVNHKNYVIYVM